MSASFAFVKYRILGEISELILIILCLVSLLMAWFSWKFVETHLDQKLSKWKFVLKYSIIFAFSFHIGIWLHKSNGALAYYDTEKQAVQKLY